jgi:hypothetical protein
MRALVIDANPKRQWRVAQRRKRQRRKRTLTCGSGWSADWREERREWQRKRE